jgi:hypothetical protein
MLPIAIALSAASPIVLEHRVVIVCRFWISAVVRLGLSLALATLVYFAVLFALIESYKITEPMSLPIYVIGFAVATLVSIMAAASVSPARLCRIVTPCTCGMAILFPVSLYVMFGLAGSWRGIYLFYLIGTIAGGYGFAGLNALVRRPAARAAWTAAFVPAGQRAR